LITLDRCGHLLAGKESQAAVLIDRYLREQTG
jgi:hypothetical protein